MRSGPVSFRGLRSVARIFSPLLARKSSGFARILHDCFARKRLFENSRGLQPPAPLPRPRLVRSLQIYIFMHNCYSDKLPSSLNNYFDLNCSVHVYNRRNKNNSTHLYSELNYLNLLFF